VYSLGRPGLWIHHYGANTLNTRLNDGARLTLSQKTDYPWDGRVRITLESIQSKQPFPIRLRIPGWARGATVTINGQPHTAQPKPATYLPINHAWRSGDTIELNLPMAPRLMQAHPRAEQLRNQVAVMRGPILYCLESTDLPPNVNLDNVYLPSDTRLTPQRDTTLAFGTRSLTGQALHRPERDWGADLYRPLANTPLEPLAVKLVPYHAWANRGISTMSVWLPVVLRD
jgi:DUF1680 family protein